MNRCQAIAFSGGATNGGADGIASKVAADKLPVPGLWSLLMGNSYSVVMPFKQLVQLLAVLECSKSCFRYAVFVFLFHRIL